MAIVLWLALVPAVTAVLAGMRNRNVVSWYLIGIAAPVIGAVVVLLLSPRDEHVPVTAGGPPA